MQKKFYDLTLTKYAKQEIRQDLLNGLKTNLSIKHIQAEFNQLISFGVDSKQIRVVLKLLAQIHGEITSLNGPMSTWRLLQKLNFSPEFARKLAEIEKYMQRMLYDASEPSDPFLFKYHMSYV